LSYLKELDVAKSAAENAATIIREFANNEEFKINLKGKNDLVTDADLASEKKIIEVIKATFPNDLILAEESSHYKSLPSERIWIIDPIDGTTNFAHGFPVYCVSIALWENGEAKVGLVHEVAHDELFWAVEGQGAWFNDKKIKISGITEPSESLIGTGFPYNNLDLVENYLKLFKVMMDKTHGVRRPGSAAWDLCNVACGRIEGFYEYGLSPWDVAAATLIIKEAGGIIFDWKGEQNWLFGQRIVAGNKPICDFLLTEIGECFSEEMLSLD
tara:strand:- start:3015 stop:3827 length:813 start_codon:yes stop_codon:yes gene_type:complete